MNRPTFERILQALLVTAVKVVTWIAAGCRRPTAIIHAPLQPDGWSARPVAITARFAPDADLDPLTRTPVGDAGYYLYVLSESADWDFSTPKSLLISIWMRPSGHGWLILESPGNRFEFGHTGDFGLAQPRYHEGVLQGIKRGDTDPISYMWQTMSDGQFQTGKPNRPPTFVWRMPITRRRHQLIHEFVTQRKYDQFGVRTLNCADMVVETAAVAGINLINRICLTLPSETKMWGRMTRVWTDPQYRILEFSTLEVLEPDLRHLAKMGIGSDATEWYRAWKH